MTDTMKPPGPDDLRRTGEERCPWTTSAWTTPIRCELRAGHASDHASDVGRHPYAICVYTNDEGRTPDEQPAELVSDPDACLLVGCLARRHDDDLHVVRHREGRLVYLRERPASS